MTDKRVPFIYKPNKILKLTMKEGKEIVEEVAPNKYEYGVLYLNKLEINHMILVLSTRLKQLERE